MLLLLIESVCDIYGVEERIATLVNSTCIHIIPLINPDGIETN